MTTLRLGVLEESLLRESLDDAIAAVRDEIANTTAVGAFPDSLHTRERMLLSLRGKLERDLQRRDEPTD